MCGDPPARPPSTTANRSRRPVPGGEPGGSDDGDPRSTSKSYAALRVLRLASLVASTASAMSVAPASAAEGVAPSLPPPPPWARRARTASRTTARRWRLAAGSARGPAARRVASTLDRPAPSAPRSSAKKSGRPAHTVANSLYARFWMAGHRSVSPGAAAAARAATSPRGRPGARARAASMKVTRRAAGDSPPWAAVVGGSRAACSGPAAASRVAAARAARADAKWSRTAACGAAERAYAPMAVARGPRSPGAAPTSVLSKRGSQFLAWDSRVARLAAATAGVNWGGGGPRLKWPLWCPPSPPSPSSSLSDRPPVKPAPPPPLPLPTPSPHWSARRARAAQMGGRRSGRAVKARAMSRACVLNGKMGNGNGWEQVSYEEEGGVCARLLPPTTLAPGARTRGARRVPPSSHMPAPQW